VTTSCSLRPRRRATIRVIRGAAATLGVILAAAAVLSGALVASSASVPGPWYVLFALAVAPGVGATARFALSATAERAEQVETLSAVSVLLLILLALGLLLSARGLA